MYNSHIPSMGTKCHIHTNTHTHTKPTSSPSFPTGTDTYHAHLNFCWFAFEGFENSTYLLNVMHTEFCVWLNCQWVWLKAHFHLHNGNDISFMYEYQLMVKDHLVLQHYLTYSHLAYASTCIWPWVFKHAMHLWYTRINLRHKEVPTKKKEKLIHSKK